MIETQNKRNPHNSQTLDQKHRKVSSIKFRKGNLVSHHAEYASNADLLPCIRGTSNRRGGCGTKPIMDHHEED